MSESVYAGLTGDERRIIESMAKSAELSPAEIESVLKPVVAAYPPDSDRRQLVINALVSHIGKKQGPQAANQTLDRISAMFDDKNEIIIEEDSVLKHLESQARPGGQTRQMPSLEEQVMEKLGRLLPSERYEMVKQLGSGGMGAVYLVQDRLFGSPVAKKMPHSNDPGISVKFVREARIARKLDHPNFVPVHEFGVDDEFNKLYMIMKAVNGKTIDDLIDVKRRNAAGEKAYSLNDFLRIMVQVCHGVGYMHKKKSLIHQDLKPANIMVGEFGEVYVMDVGGARDVRESEEDVVFTPQYVAPEQVVGKADARSDVYSLGAILYNISERKPFRVFPPGAFETDAGPKMIVAKKGMVGFPGFDAVKTPKPLQSIVMKATRGSLNERYQSVDEFREDIQAFLDDRLVKAHSYSFLERSGRWGRRNIGKILAGLAAAGVLVAGSAGYTWLAGRARDAERDRERQKIIAMEASAAKDRAEAALSVERKEQLERAQKRNKAYELLWRVERAQKRRDFEAALLLCNELVAADSAWNQGYFKRGEINYLRNDGKSAIDDFLEADRKSVAEAGARDMRALYSAAMAHYDLRGSIAEAARISRQIADGSEKGPYQLLHNCIVSLDEKKYEQLFASAEKAAVIGETSAEGKFWMAYCHSIRPSLDYTLTDPAKAVECIEDAMNSEPENVRFMSHGARIFVANGRNDDALKLAGRLLGIKKDPEFYFFRACAYHNQRDFRKCLDELALAEKCGALNDQHLDVRGTAYSNLKEYDNAYAAFTESLKLKRKMSTFANRGIALFKMGRTEEAIQDYDEAIAMNGSYGLAYLRRGEAYAKAGRLNQAVVDFDSAAKHSQPHGYLYAGKILDRMGKESEAAQRYRAYLKTNATEERDFVQNWLREREH